jgi:hypothetical protein
MNALLAHPRAKHAFARGHQDLIDLRELRIAQAIKRVIEMDLERETSGTPLSHAFAERLETLSVHA